MRSEHCVGFLKGRWSSLRGLRLRIDQPEHIQFACIWIISCIVLHSFAIEHEQGREVEVDDFFQDGIAILEQDRRANMEDSDEAHIRTEREREAAHDVELLRGRLRREQLKRDLFMYLDSQ